jgi:fructose/tagatose bisphosphate aldolase
MIISKRRSETLKALTSPTRRFVSLHYLHKHDLTGRVYLQYYDPRVWVREGEKTLSERVKEACRDLGNVGTSAQPTNHDRNLTSIKDKL